MRGTIACCISPEERNSSKDLREFGACGDSRIMTGSFSSVPAVNYARLTSPETKSDELNKLREAIFVVGFLYLTNTGLEVCQ